MISIVSHNKGRIWKAFKKRLVRKMHGPKRTEVIGDWRKLPNESFMVCNCSPYIWVIKSRMSWAGCVAYMLDDMYRILVGKRKRYRLLGRPKYGWGGNK